MTDVLIAGAGIAGSALAIQLGRRGFSVSVFERSQFPREKPCGEGLMPAGVAALERLGIDTTCVGAEFRGIRYYSGERMAKGRFPESVVGPCTGRGVRRRELDGALAHIAGKTPGVAVHAGMRVSGPLVENRNVTGLVVEGQPIRGRLVVAADGAQSRLRHVLGIDAPVRRKRIGMRMHFRSDPDARPETYVEVFLGDGHDLYVTPLRNGEFVVAALAEAAAIEGQVEELFRRWCAGQTRLARRLRDAEPVSNLLVTSPISGRAHRRVLPGLVLLGDAAGFADPVTGGGMTQALQSAELLAKHLASEREWTETSLEAFDRQRETMLRDYRWLTAAVLWLGKHPMLIDASLAALRAMPGLFSHLLGVSAGMRHFAGRGPCPVSCARASFL